MDNDIVKLATQLIIKHKPDIIYVADCDEKCYLYCSRIEDILGYNTKKLYKKDGFYFFTSLLHPEDNNRMFHKHSDGMLSLPPDMSDSNKKVYAATFRIRHKWGTWKLFEAWNTVIGFSNDEKPKYIFGMLFDRSEVKKDLTELALNTCTSDNLRPSLSVINLVHKDYPNLCQKKINTEKEIRYLIQQGYSSELISSALHIDLNEVEYQRNHILASQGIPDSADFISTLERII